MQIPDVPQAHYRLLMGHYYQKVLPFYFTITELNEDGPPLN
mgnify:FL=1